ncbi:hypothetical protein WA016_06017 [Myxococcus stipitatus]
MTRGSGHVLCSRAAAMNLSSQQMRRFRPLSSGLCALAVASLAACNPDTPSGPLGEVHGEYDGDWKYFSDRQEAVLYSPGRDTVGDVSTLTICGRDVGAPKNWLDDWGLCFHVSVDTALLGTGPTTLVIDGLAVGAAGFIPRDISFTRHEGHSPPVRSAWGSTFCNEGPQGKDMRVATAGTLELWVNDGTRFAGQLRVETSGPSAGRCPAPKAQANLMFDVQPQPPPEW